MAVIFRSRRNNKASVHCRKIWLSLGKLSRVDEQYLRGIHVLLGFISITLQPVMDLRGRQIRLCFFCAVACLFLATFVLPEPSPRDPLMPSGLPTPLKNSKCTYKEVRSTTPRFQAWVAKLSPVSGRYVERIQWLHTRYIRPKFPLTRYEFVFNTVSALFFNWNANFFKSRLWTKISMLHLSNLRARSTSANQLQKCPNLPHYSLLQRSKLQERWPAFIHSLCMHERGQVYKRFLPVCRLACILRLYLISANSGIVIVDV